jgi:hypothetical protein
VPNRFSTVASVFVSAGSCLATGCLPAGIGGGGIQPAW